MDLSHSSSLSFISKTQTWLLQVEILYSLSPLATTVLISFLRDLHCQDTHDSTRPIPSPCLSSFIPPFTLHWLLTISSRHLSGHPTPRALLRLLAQPRNSFTTCPCDPSLQPVLTPSSRSHSNITSSGKCSCVSLAPLWVISQRGAWRKLCTVFLLSL